jgi:hypothetical protein
MSTQDIKETEMERKNQENPSFDVDLQWFAEDPPVEPVVEPPVEEPPAEPPKPPDKPRWFGTWVGQAPDKYRKDEAKLDDLLKHKNIGEVLDRMYEAESKLTVQADVPEAPEGYEFAAVEFPKELEGDEQKKNREDLGAYLADATNEIRQMAHELKWPKETAQRVFKFLSDRVFGQWKSAQDAFEKAKNDGLEVLKKEWKADFGPNAELARRAIQSFGGDELVAAMDEAGISNHPAIVKAFLKIGKAMGEDTLVPGSATHELSPEEQRQAKLKERYPKMAASNPELFEGRTEQPLAEIPEHLKGRYPSMVK